MKKIIAIVLMLLPIVALAQNSEKFTLKGIALDTTKNEAASYATVLLLSEGEVPVASSYTSETGRFKISALKGSYTLKINFVGYAPFSMDVEISEDMNLGVLNISESIDIEAVQVVGQLITSDIDKVSYNTDMDPEAPALTALEMMRKVPMLSVDGEDNIRLRGESSFKILVNGKSSSLMNSNYQDVLRSMPASSIKRIEVITSPPAKYDAEGVAGIINIVTVKRGPEGVSGSVNAGYGSFGDWNAGVYLAVSKGKFNLSANIAVSEFVTPEINFSGETINKLSEDSYLQNSETSSEYRGNYQNVGLEASYEFDTLNLLTFSVSGTLGTTGSTGTSFYDLYSNMGVNTAYYSYLGSNSSGWGGIGASVDYQRSFANSPDRLLTVSYKVDYNPNDASYDAVQSVSGSGEFAIESLGIEGYERRADSKAWGMEHAIQVDYFDKITMNHQIEAGLKYTLRPSVSNSLTESLTDGVWAEDLSLKNDLDYMQQIASLYAAYQYSLDNFSVKAGARAEYTVNDGEFISEVTTPMYNDYFNLIPYLTLGYKIDDSQSMKFGYTQRISRPGISQLNPFVEENTVIFKSGNPNLEAELSHALELSYGIFKPIYNINASLSARYTDNAIQDVLTVVDNQLYSQPENVGENISYIASIGGGVRLWDNRISIYANGSGGYVKVKANDGTGQQNDGWQMNCFGQFSINAWKEGNISMYGGCGKNMVALQTDELFYWFHGMGVSQSFFEKRLNLNLSVQSPFAKYSKFSMSLSDDYMDVNFVQSQLSRSVKLSLSWRFGQQKGSVKRTNRSIENTDAVAESSSGAGGL
ncbi:MAG: outer membrane beta-barrel family protein [Rikenellaceae bacterium]